MVFGFLTGKFEVILEKFNYSPGETINGKITFKLKKPTKAKKLKVALIGEKITNRMKRDSQGRTTSSQDKTHVYNFEMPLDGEKEYTEGEYDFQIKIPANILQNVPLPKGAIGDAVKAIQLLSGAQTKISWYVRANLDISMGIDVSKKIQINIG